MMNTKTTRITKKSVRNNSNCRRTLLQAATYSLKSSLIAPTLHAAQCNAPKNGLDIGVDRLRSALPFLGDRYVPVKREEGSPATPAHEAKPSPNNSTWRNQMNTLPLSVHTPKAVQSPKACLELDMPLHAFTDSGIHVAQLVGTLLNEIADVDHEVSHADILQALAITTAVRMAMADASAKTGGDFSLELLDIDVGSAGEAAPRAA